MGIRHAKYDLSVSRLGGRFYTGALRLAPASGMMSRSHMSTILGVGLLFPSHAPAASTAAQENHNEQACGGSPGHTHESSAFGCGEAKACTLVIYDFIHLDSCDGSYDGRHSYEEHGEQGSGEEKTAKKDLFSISHEYGGKADNKGDEGQDDGNNV